jgi:hypothetical protein
MPIHGGPKRLDTTRVQIALTGLRAAVLEVITAMIASTECCIIDVVIYSTLCIQIQYDPAEGWSGLVMEKGVANTSLSAAMVRILQTLLRVPMVVHQEKPTYLLH